MAAFDRLDWSSTAVETATLSGANSTGAITPTLSDATGWPDGSDGPFDILVGGIEIMRVTSRSTTTLTIAAGGRGMFGTSATAHAASGVAVKYVVTGSTLDEMNQMVAILGNGSAGVPLVGGGLDTVPAFAAVTAAGLATNSVTTVKILDDNVTAAKIADGAIDDAAKLAANVVTTAKILDANVTTAKITAGAVTATELGTGAVTSAKILDGTIATGDIAANAITSALIADGTIVAGDIADGTITNAKLAAPVTGWDTGGDLKMGTWTASPTGGALVNGQTITDAQSLYPETWTNTPAGWKSGSSLVLPDWRGLMPVMLKPTDTDFDAIGETGGAKTVTLTAAESGLPAHTHTVFADGAAAASGSAKSTVTTSSGDGNKTTASTGGSAAASAHTNMPPFVAVNWSIRLK